MMMTAMMAASAMNLVLLLSSMNEQDKESVAKRKGGRGARFCESSDDCPTERHEASNRGATYLMNNVFYAI